MTDCSGLSMCFCAGLVSHSDLDDRAIEALKEFNEEGALQVLLQFKDSDLSHVQVCLRTLSFHLVSFHLHVFGTHCLILTRYDFSLIEIC